jgi:UDP-glucose 4-epimerase
VILVTGGAGYIGSVTVAMLRRQGEAVVVLDDCARGHAAALPMDVPLVRGKVGDRALLAALLQRHRIDACIHFAALAYVGESVEKPGLYFQNNVVEGLSLLEGLLAAGVDQLVFSSTCATYGQPEVVPIAETEPQRPTHPYGWSKLMFEAALRSYAGTSALRFVSLRYFNAAGATTEHGDHHEPETHVIPLALRAAAGTGPALRVMGTDYPTDDGTAIRDYVHVLDLASAHLRALEHLRRGGASELLNLGTGRGTSVLDLVATIERVTGRDLPRVMHAPRPGDPARLVARPDRAAAVLGWRAEHSSLEEIVASAWAWSKAHPRGYSG